MALIQKKDEKIVYIHLPDEGGLKDSLNNIEHCICAIESYAGARVIGYYATQNKSNPEVLHQAMQEEEAKTLKNTFPNFKYITLEELADQKKKVPPGKRLIITNFHLS